MKKIIIAGTLGFYMLMSFSTDAHGAEATGIVITSSTSVDIGEIKDPYEQCLAYVKLKKIEGTDCKKIAESIRQKMEKSQNPPKIITPKPTPLPERLPPIRECLMAGSDCNWGGTIQNPDFKWLMGAIEKLSPQEKIELAKMIRSYLQSKNVKTPSIDVYIPKKDEMKTAIENKKQEIQIMKNTKQEEIRTKQEAMRARLKSEPIISKKGITDEIITTQLQ